MAERCHAAKSLRRVPVYVAAISPSMLDSSASIVIDSDLPWWFCSVSTAYNKLHQADPTKCRAEAWNHRYFRRCWCMAGLTSRFSTLRVIVVYPLLIASHDTMQKNFPFSPLKQLSNMKKRRSTSLAFNSYGTQFSCFWIIPHAFKRSETVV